MQLLYLNRSLDEKICVDKGNPHLAKEKKKTNPHPYSRVMRDNFEFRASRIKSYNQISFAFPVLKILESWAV